MKLTGRPTSRTAGLDETGAFTQATQKRYDDTALLLEAPLRAGSQSPDGTAAVQPINQMDCRFDIPNHELLYVLSTFVVVPTRWLERYGWRPPTGAERLASVRYYQALGRHLGITGVPTTYESFETLMDDYEAAHFAFDPGAAGRGRHTGAAVVVLPPAGRAAGAGLQPRAHA